MGNSSSTAAIAATIAPPLLAARFAGLSSMPTLSVEGRTCVNVSRRQSYARLLRRSAQRQRIEDHDRAAGKKAPGGPFRRLEVARTGGDRRLAEERRRVFHGGCRLSGPDERIDHQALGPQNARENAACQ